MSKNPLIGRTIGEIKKVLDNNLSKSLHFPIQILIGCSGGQDSIALLKLLHIITTKQNSIYKNLKIHVAHINHGLRKESEEEETFVKEYCSSLNIVFHVRHLKLEKPCAAATAREKRYDAFLDIADTVGARHLFLAHTKTDNVETILMNIIRGCGLSGLEGIKENTTRCFKTSHYQNNILHLIRPLLKIARNETEQICKSLKLKFVSDKTNDDDSHLRVNLRKNIIPAFPGLENSLLSLANQAVDVNSYLKEDTHVFFEKIIKYKEDTEKTLKGAVSDLDIDILDNLREVDGDYKTQSVYKILYLAKMLPKVLVIKNLREILLKEGISIEMIRYTVYTDIFNSIKNGENKQWYIKPNSILRLFRDKLHGNMLSIESVL